MHTHISCFDVGELEAMHGMYLVNVGGCFTVLVLRFSCCFSILDDRSCALNVTCFLMLCNLPRELFHRSMLLRKTSWMR